LKNTNLHCANDTKVFCDIETSVRYPSGICIHCGRVLADINTITKQIHDLIRLYPDNFELFHDIADIVRENNFQLTDEEIRTICTHYFKQGKQTKERLNTSDELYQIMHRANETLINPINRPVQKEKVDLIYLSEGLK